MITSKNIGMTDALAQSIELLINRSRVLRLWLRLLLDAQKQESEHNGMTIERGQVAISFRSLSSKLGLPTSTLVRTIDELVREGLVVRTTKHNLERTTKHSFTLVTICNYEDYVCTKNSNWNVPRNASEEEKWNVPRNVPKKAECNVTQDPLKEEQSHVEEDNEQPPKTNRFIPPTIEQVRAHIAEKGYSFTAEEFLDYYTANGWMLSKNTKVKNWKACCSTWERKRKEKATVSSAIRIENEALLSQYEAGDGGYGAFLHYIADNAPNVVLKVKLPTQEEFVLINKNHRRHFNEALKVVNGDSWLRTTTFYAAFIKAIQNIRKTTDNGTLQQQDKQFADQAFAENMRRVIERDSRIASEMPDVPL